MGGMKVEKRDGGRVPVKFWTDGVHVDHNAADQLHLVAQLPFVHRHVAAMPDVHFGIGATVGSVIPFLGAVVPAAVGVDIGCGMVAWKLPGANANRLPDNLSEVRSAIESVVPVGFSNHGDRIPRHAEDAWRRLWSARDASVGDTLEHLKPSKAAPVQQMGTLGGGNHFVELCIDEHDDTWVMLHSGSRGIGNRIGRHFIERAKRECERSNIELPHRDLAYLPEGTDHFDEYIAAVGWAQEYARLNREVMLRSILEALRGLGPPFEEIASGGAAETAINCHHNYVERESHFGKNVWLTRKGAVRARKGDLGIIPGSMGAKSFIVRGLGNPDSFHSCSHGAGRAMSRKQAKATFTVEDHAAATAHVECRKDVGVLDETPGAYKDIDAVMAAQADLVEIVHTLRQVVCVKG